MENDLMDVLESANNTIYTFVRHAAKTHGSVDVVFVVSPIGTSEIVNITPAVAYVIGTKMIPGSDTTRIRINNCDPCSEAVHKLSSILYGYANENKLKQIGL